MEGEWENKTGSRKEEKESHVFVRHYSGDLGVVLLVLYLLSALAKDCSNSGHKLENPEDCRSALLTAAYVQFPA